MCIDLSIEYWGRKAYREAWDRQKELVERVQESGGRLGYVIAVEHDPVYTLGFHGNAANMLASDRLLAVSGAECIRIERGGDITYHGPGQLVVYPIIDLRSFHLGVKKYIELLEDSVIELLVRYGISASSNNDAIGVWIDWDKPEARKICAIGVKVSHGVTMHGLALNVNTNLNAFGLINPCGFVDKGVTSIENEIGSNSAVLPAFNEVAQSLTEIIRRRLCQKLLMQDS